MTKDEAIKDIEENILPVVGGKSLRMAIDALKEQPEPPIVNFSREMDRETIEKLKKEMENAPVLIMAVNDSAQPEPQWIPCSERLPERIINDDVETEQEFFVTIKERWPGEEWTYHTDLAWVPGEYIDDFWQTYNDWKEGQEVQVIAWMPLPEPYNPT